MKFKKNSPRIFFGLLVGVVAFIGVILLLRTFSRGDDFHVFHRVAQRFWDGVRPYDTVTFGNMVFKYPPWLLPFFLPFGFLDLESAKIIWGLIEAAALVAIVVRMHQGFGRTGKAASPIPAVRPWVQALFLTTLFALFGSHGMTGQITLVVLAIAVWTDPLKSSFTRFFFLNLALSAKLTSFFPMVHARSRKKLGQAMLGCAALFAVLSLPIYLHAYDGRYGAMRTEWSKAMFSGTDDVDSVRIGFTTREVQGMPSLVLRKGGLDERNSVHVLGAIAFSMLLLGGLWFWFSRRLPAQVQWLGWLAVMPLVQPLAWFHVFLFVYPVLVVGAEAAIRRGKLRDFWILFGSALVVGAITAKTLGSVGLALEFWSIKLWGSLVAIVFFALQFWVGESADSAGAKAKTVVRSRKTLVKKRARKKLN